VFDAVDLVADLFGKYEQLILGFAVHSGVVMEPWPHVFTVPWIADREASPREVMTKLDESERRRAQHGRS
jgi:hypothetical protein